MITDTLADAIQAVERHPLGKIPPAQAARIKRRVVDREALADRLDVAAFSSALR